MHIHALVSRAHTTRVQIQNVAFRCIEERPLIGTQSPEDTAVILEQFIDIP